MTMSVWASPLHQDLVDLLPPFGIFTQCFCCPTAWAILCFTPITKAIWETIGTFEVRRLRYNDYICLIKPLSIKPPRPSSLAICACTHLQFIFPNPAALSTWSYCCIIEFMLSLFGPTMLDIDSQRPWIGIIHPIKRSYLSLPFQAQISDFVTWRVKHNFAEAVRQDENYQKLSCCRPYLDIWPILLLYHKIDNSSTLLPYSLIKKYYQTCRPLPLRWCGKFAHFYDERLRFCLIFRKSLYKIPERFKFGVVLFSEHIDR